MSGSDPTRPIDEQRGSTSTPQEASAADLFGPAEDEAASEHRAVPQFGMRGLLIFTTGLCILFAVLAAMRVAYWQMLLGFLATAGVSLAVILLLELYAHYDSDRRGRRGAERRRPPRLGHRGTTRSLPPSMRPHRQAIDLSELDPTGIEFVEPAGIAYLDMQDGDDGSLPPILADFADEASPPSPAPSADAEAKPPE